MNMTPTKALQILKKRNDAYCNGRVRKRQIDRATRLSLTETQHPFAACVCCSDSRVSPELLFGIRLGELFVVRNAGNSLGSLALGSLDFAVRMLNVPLIVIMGHERCGAVQAAVDAATNGRRFTDNIAKIIEPIIPAVVDAMQCSGGYDDAVRHNVSRTVRRLRYEGSSILETAQSEGRLEVVGAYCSLMTGQVDFFEPEDVGRSPDRMTGQLDAQLPGPGTLEVRAAISPSDGAL